MIDIWFLFLLSLVVFTIICHTIITIILGPESAENWIFDSPSKTTVAIEGKSQTIRPQVVNVKMRKNGPVDVNIRFKRPSTYPVDMYYLMGKAF